MKPTGTPLLVSLALNLLVLPLASDAQVPAKVHRIGVLDTSSSTASSGRVEAFRQGLRESGLVEGQNLHIDWRFAEGKELAIASLAKELVGLKPEVLVPLGGAGSGELKSATTEIPIVLAGSHDRWAVAGPAAATLAQSQENVTGFISTTRALDEKRMEILRETVPAISRVASLLDAIRFPLRPGETVRSERWGFTFVGIPVRSSNEFESAIATALKEMAGALSVPDTPMFYTHRQELADLAITNRLPWVAPDREYAETGALMSYGPDGKELARLAATYVARILKGVKPWNLPVQQSTKVELVINLRTAKVLGLTIPPSVRARADEVIE